MPYRAVYPHRDLTRTARFVADASGLVALNLIDRLPPIYVCISRICKHHAADNRLHLRLGHRLRLLPDSRRCLYRFEIGIAQGIAAAGRRSLLRGRIVPVLPRNLRLSESNAKLV